MLLKKLRVLPSRSLRSSERLLLAYSVSLFLLLLLVSLALFLTSGSWARRTLFFPEISSQKLLGETRFLPRRRSLELDVQILVEEAILGPELPMHRPLLPRETRLISVLARQRRVYLSLSSGILREGGESPFQAEQALQALGNVILFNFPRIRRLELLIDGQVPSGGSVFRFRPQLLK
jgi:hypothetical protein